MGPRQSCSKACTNCAADCARPGHGLAEDFDDDRPGGDPAGATFEETLEDLSSLDRQLIQFCATSNLAAVRWLIFLGAHWEACDANGTTCLHSACRAGALAVVKELLRYPDLVEAVDCANWSPLHIAALMGRREVVISLLQARASLTVRNSKGQVAAELCADSGTHEAIRSFEMHQRTSPMRPWVYGKEGAASEDLVGSRLQYEPFFVPRQPVLRSSQYKKELQRIGMVVFNRQPGFGLALLVACGIARDYPVDLSTFLRRSKVDIKQVGSFLGEAFSLAHTIRLEFINSVVLQNTGVVSALIQVFHMLQLPDDLQKINRLVHGVARIWWRQHERLLKEGTPKDGVRSTSPEKPVMPQLHLSEELVGLELKQYITSSDALHQLMFSTVMLHWHMYKEKDKQPKRDLTFEKWRALNAGIESDGGDVPEHVQLQIFTLISKAFVPELAVASEASRPSPVLEGGEDEGTGTSAGSEETRSRALLLSQFASTEGWAQIVGGGFPKPTGLKGVQTLTYSHVSSIFSEVTHAKKSSALRPGHSNRPAEVVAAPAVGPLRRDDFVWLSACFSLLFFTSQPQGGAPYAFLELRSVGVQGIDEGNRVVTLVGLASPGTEPGGEVPTRGDPNGQSCGGDSLVPSGPPAAIMLVLLLPDGRWQELNLMKLELRLPTAKELSQWASHFNASAGRAACLPACRLGTCVEEARP